MDGASCHLGGAGAFPSTVLVQGESGRFSLSLAPGCRRRQLFSALAAPYACSLLADFLRALERDA